MKLQAVIVVATDGACSGNTRIGGWGWVAESGRVGSGRLLDCTNNVAELTAVREALAAFPSEDIHIVTDSNYVLNSCCDGGWADRWKRNGWVTGKNQPVANRELIESVLLLKVGRTVSFEWVKGHNGHPLNEQADLLATSAARP